MKKHTVRALTAMGLAAHLLMYRYCGVIWAITGYGLPTTLLGCRCMFLSMTSATTAILQSMLRRLQSQRIHYMSFMSVVTKRDQSREVILPRSIPKAMILFVD